MLEPNAAGKMVAHNNYFHAGAYEYANFSDYTTGEAIPGAAYEWDWKMSDVVSAFCNSGMRIAFLHEFPQYFYRGYDFYEGESEQIERYPCTFSLKAVAE